MNFKMLLTLIVLFTSQSSLGWQGNQRRKPILGQKAPILSDFRYSLGALQYLPNDPKVAEDWISKCTSGAGGRLQRKPKIDMADGQFVAYTEVIYRAAPYFVKGFLCYLEPLELKSVAAPTGENSVGIIELGFSDVAPYLIYDQFSDLASLHQSTRFLSTAERHDFFKNSFLSFYSQNFKIAEITSEQIEAFKVYSLQTPEANPNLDIKNINNFASSDIDLNLYAIRNDLCYTKTTRDKESSQIEISILKDHEGLRADLISAQDFNFNSAETPVDYLLDEVNAFFAKNISKKNHCTPEFYQDLTNIRAETHEEFMEVHQKIMELHPSLKVQLNRLNEMILAGPSVNENEILEAVGLVRSLKAEIKALSEKHQQLSMAIKEIDQT